jgi:WD40 repeat protein
VADVFVSYSRRDGEFVRRLAEALTERGKDVWVDVDGVRDAEVFPAALRTAVEQSDGFVFVISPDSVASNYCEQEVEHALELNKRIVPLLLSTVPDEAVPEGVRVRNWIPCRDTAAFETAVARVVEALDTDLGWAKEHTRWLLKALEWDAEGKERSFLLRGSELAAAEGWLAGASGKEPEPTTLQSEYVAASRLAASRRQRTLLAVSGVVTVLSLGLLVFALISRSEAISARNTAKSQAVTAQSQALAADSQTQLAVDPERSILLAVAALHKAATPEATYALRGAIDASPIRYRLPDAGPQICGFDNIAAPGIAFGGHQLAEGLCGGTVVIADAQTGRVERRIHTGETGGALAYSRDGSLLAVKGLTGVKLIDARTGAIRGVGPSVRRIGGRLSIAFSPTAPLVAIGEGGEVALWNMRTRRTRFLHFPRAAVNAPVNAVSFSPDGKRLAVALLQTSPNALGLLLLDVANGRTLASAGGSVDQVAFAPDGRHVAAAETLFPSGKGAILLLDTRSFALTRTLAELPAVEASAVAFSPDGSRVAFGGFDGTAGLVSVETGQTLASYVGQTAAINQVAFSPDGRLVATASTDGTALVWRATGQERELIPVGLSIAGLATPTGQVEAVIGAGRPGAPLLVQTWARKGARAGRPFVLSPTGDVDAVFLSPDGRRAATIPTSNSPNEPVRIWDVATQHVVATVPSARAPFGGEPAFNPDGSAIAMGVPGGIARPGSIGRPPTGAPRGKRPGAPVKPQALLVVRSVRTGKDRTYGRTSCGTGWRAQTFSRTGRLLAAGSFCGEVYVWNVRTGRPLIKPVSIGGELAKIAFSPDGTRIAVASWNSTITIIDLRTGRTVAVLTSHTKGVASVSYSPDGRYLASASLDHTARIWDAHTLRPLRVLTDPAPLSWVTFSSGSNEIVTADEANVIRVWDACTDCENPRALLALAKHRVTRALTAQELRTFGG